MWSFVHTYLKGMYIQRASIHTKDTLIQSQEMVGQAVSFMAQNHNAVDRNKGFGQKEGKAVYCHRKAVDLICPEKGYWYGVI
jgi:hypothetical protein